MPSGSSDGCESSASCVCGSNRPSVSTSTSPSRGEQVGERAVDEPDAVLELRLAVLDRRLERPLEVVEHRQQLLDEPLGGARDELLLLARDPLAVVVELGLQPLERVEVLVALARHLGELVALERRRLGPPAPGAVAGGVAARPRPPRRGSASALLARSRGLGLLALVDDLVVGVLDHLVVGGGRRRRPTVGVDADACA